MSKFPKIGLIFDAEKDMAQQQQTPQVVPPSDQANCEVVKGSFELESGTCGESELVCELPHSEEYVLPQEENCPKDDIPPKDGHPARNAYNDGNISQSTQDASENQTTHTLTLKKQLNVTCIAFLLLLCFPNLIGADQKCHRVLTANDVNKSESNLLDFSGGQYKEIEEGAFGNSEAAERIDLSQNGFSTLPKDIFDDVINVFSVNMAGNNFSSYPCAFRKSETLSNLEQLRFMGNYIDYLGKYYFIGKKQLSVMDFSSNRLESIHKQALDPLSALEIADFSENQLTSLSFLNVTKLKNLVQLYVKNNILKYLNIRGFSNCPEITRISISEDSMTLERNDREDPMVFWIAGNSETLSCEVNKHDIERAEIPIEYNFTCQNRNNTSRVLNGSRRPQNSPTTVMPSVTNLPTPFQCVNDNLPLILGLSFALLCLVLAIIRLVWLQWLVRKLRHKGKVEQHRRMRVSSNSNGTNGVQLVEETVQTSSEA